MQSAPLTAAQALRPLQHLLQQAAPYWRVSPFTTAQPAWMEEHPELAAACLGLSDEQAEALDREPQALQAWLAPQLPLLGDVDTALQVPMAAAPKTLGNARWSNGIPGRKWAQIEAFAAQIPEDEHPLLDWCSGKAHLGRSLARQQPRPLHAVERNPTLCAQGKALAQQAGVKAHYQCKDVLQQAVEAPPKARVLALHACGDLHRQLIQSPLLDAAQSLHLAPCCYHLWLEEGFCPLSSAASAQDLQLDRNQVQLAVQDTVNAPAAELRKQATLAAWRLGFDCLQRDLRGVDEYLQTPSLPHRLLAEGFPALCHRLAAHKGLSIGTEPNWAQLEERGWERLRQARRLQLVRHGFRRAIEMWLVLDLAARLEERGFAVSLQQFCPREISPRNLLISAHKAD